LNIAIFRELVQGIADLTVIEPGPRFNLANGYSFFGPLNRIQNGLFNFEGFLSSSPCLALLGLQAFSPVNLHCDPFEQVDDPRYGPVNLFQLSVQVLFRHVSPPSWFEYLH
jgi:hypothetical protein